jgi:hypothetical protein
MMAAGMIDFGDNSSNDRGSERPQACKRNVEYLFSA